MRQILLAIGALDANAQTARLRIAQIGAGADLEILLLAGRPCLHIAALDLKIGQIAAAAFQRAHRNIQRAEEIDGVLPKLLIPHHGIFGLADDDHFLLFELMDAIYAAFFDAVRADLLAEAGRIAGQGLRQILFIQNGIDELADHAVFAGADQIQIFTLDLVHHVFHFRKAHHAVDHRAADHERRHIIGKAAVDHEIARVGQNRGMQARDIALQIIEAVAAGSARRVQIDTVQLFHDVHMIGHLEIRHDRLAKAFIFHVFGIILANRHGSIDDVRDHHHALFDFRRQFFFLLFQIQQFIVDRGNLFLGFLGLFLLSLAHQHADLLGNLVALCAQRIAALHGLAVFLVQRDYLVHQHQLGVLKLLFDVLANEIGIGANQINIDHEKFPPVLCV